MLTELRELAKAATPGPWIYDETELPAKRIHHPDGTMVAEVSQMRMDGRHIAAANPETILRLLDLVDEMGEALGKYQGRAILGISVADEALAKWREMK